VRKHLDVCLFLLRISPFLQNWLISPVCLWWRNGRNKHEKWKPVRLCCVLKHKTISLKDIITQCLKTILTFQPGAAVNTLTLFQQDAFSLLAYSDPWNSPVGNQLDPIQREPVCSALNSAILGK
jgi:hypothetical protein